MDNSDILKKYVCKNPFEFLDVQERASYICCPSWCPTSITEPNSDLGWDGEIIKDIRKSILDGSYSHCDKNVCPSLNYLLNTKKQPYNFVEKEKFLKEYEIKNIDDIDNIDFKCEHILFGFDRSCNLKCPSCRKFLVPNDKIENYQHKKKLEILDKIEKNLSKTLKSILITGSGDPFYSNIYRNYLINFDISKYPNLEEIKIITNGIMLDSKMWNKLQSKKYIKSIEVSIDAGTKDTYENVTRLNGNWDRLISNLKFISKLESVKFFQLSFVVSELNYKEMKIFYDVITDIFKGRNFEVVYRQHVWWGEGAYSQKEVDEISIFNPTHSKHNLFLKELNKIHNKPHVNHNFNHLIKIDNSIKLI